MYQDEHADDLPVAERSVFDDPRLRELLRIDTLQLLEHMHQAWEHDDFPELARLAHKLKGSAGQFGEAALEREAQALEHSAEQQQRKPARTRLQSLDALCRRLFPTAPANAPQE
jgi:HPt (histidine-containing phosphotransfer) domain-containing protein